MYSFWRLENKAQFYHSFITHPFRTILHVYAWCNYVSSRPHVLIYILLLVIRRKFLKVWKGFISSSRAVGQCTSFPHPLHFISPPQTMNWILKVGLLRAFHVIDHCSCLWCSFLIVLIGTRMKVSHVLSVCTRSQLW